MTFTEKTAYRTHVLEHYPLPNTDCPHCEEFILVLKTIAEGHEATVLNAFLSGYLSRGELATWDKAKAIADLLKLIKYNPNRNLN